LEKQRDGVEGRGSLGAGQLVLEKGGAALEQRAGAARGGVGDLRRVALARAAAAAAEGRGEADDLAVALASPQAARLQAPQPLARARRRAGGAAHAQLGRAAALAEEGAARQLHLISGQLHDDRTGAAPYPPRGRRSARPPRRAA